MSDDSLEVPPLSKERERKIRNELRTFFIHAREESYLQLNKISQIHKNKPWYRQGKKY